MPDPSVWWFHHLDPFALQLSDRIGVRWYSLAYLAGLAWGWWMLVRWHRAGRSPLDGAAVQDFVLYAGIGMIVGGRLLYCLVYGWQHWLADPLYLFKLWEGGMASHGGLLGLAAGSWWYARKRKVRLSLLTDLVSATAAMGILLGRLANFVNGELWGRSTDAAWGVWFPGALVDDLASAAELRQVQLPEATRAAMAVVDRHPGAPPAPEIQASLLDGVRWLAERGVTVLPRHPSQLYAAALEGALLLLLILPIHARHRRPGVTTGAMFIAYGIVRIIGETWRQNDVQATPILGLNYGQWLSMPVVVVGLGILVWALRRPAIPEEYASAAAR